jgi:hypothetical protein
MVPRRAPALVAAVTALLGTLVLLGVTGTVAVAAPGPATGARAAAPKPPPAGVTITGAGLDEPLTLHADQHPTQVSAVVDQVSWLGQSGPAAAPKQADLGPKYTVVVLAGDVAKQSYDLYPLAKGGPRAYRPAKQPDARKTGAAWFLGRLSMPETLRGVGVPLPPQIDTLSGGIGGGERVIPDEAINPGQDLGELFGELRHLMLLNILVIVLITGGLAGIALLIRRRTR